MKSVFLWIELIDFISDFILKESIQLSNKGLESSINKTSSSPSTFLIVISISPSLSSSFWLTYVRFNKASYSLSVIYKTGYIIRVSK